MVLCGFESGQKFSCEISLLPERKGLTFAANGDKAQLQGPDHRWRTKKLLMTQQPSPNEFPISSSFFLLLPLHQVSYSTIVLRKSDRNLSESPHPRWHTAIHGIVPSLTGQHTISTSRTVLLIAATTRMSANTAIEGSIPSNLAISITRLLTALCTASIADALS